jgi:hypothetical protein
LYIVYKIAEVWTSVWLEKLRYAGHVGAAFTEVEISYTRSMHTKETLKPSCQYATIGEGDTAEHWEVKGGGG